MKNITNTCSFGANCGDWEGYGSRVTLYHCKNFCNLETCIVLLGEQCSRLQVALYAVPLQILNFYVIHVIVLVFCMKHRIDIPIWSGFYLKISIYWSTVIVQPIRSSCRCESSFAQSLFKTVKIRGNNFEAMEFSGQQVILRNKQISHVLSKKHSIQTLYSWEIRNY